MVQDVLKKLVNMLLILFHYDLGGVETLYKVRQRLFVEYFVQYIEIKD
jgi:hypothetical protein